MCPCTRRSTMSLSSPFLFPTVFANFFCDGRSSARGELWEKKTETRHGTSGQGPRAGINYRPCAPPRKSRDASLRSLSPSRGTRHACTIKVGRKRGSGTLLSRVALGYGKGCIHKYGEDGKKNTT